MIRQTTLSDRIVAGVVGCLIVALYLLQVVNEWGAIVLGALGLVFFTASAFSSLLSHEDGDSQFRTIAQAD